MTSMAVMSRAIRPKQWTKNVVVLAALVFAAGDRSQQLDWTAMLGQAVAAMLLFCLASSAVYLLNDIKDVMLDRAHPEKRFRPIASGELPVGVARVMAAILVAVALGGSWVVSPRLTGVLVGYLVLQAAYVYALKRVPLVDLFVISMGFVLRALAGAVAISVKISPWLLLVTLLLAMFLALCKRRQEMVLVLDAGAETRPSLLGYNEKMLDQLIAMTGAATLVVYALYTQWPDTVQKFGSHNLGFTLPYVMFGLFRYITLVYHHQRGERPEQVLLTDRPLLICVALYAVTTVAILSLGRG
ncbi:MAG TPA: decaprenyl-phosphate phosphoribosyltransferase [Kiritimatiellia bacterium]|nr:decaprenyl-phosphate phosphoribosyltransferase [Kiritimatiellia bacterium]HMP00506.1 decaprenyl-phosphate phosphoribosyltransferase [Kiritimatiellia bacterium]HMP98078.1 decaprenyl-phosphate phosphoribosyltransferase [Kiritimatiellia bacterium]